MNLISFLGALAEPSAVHFIRLQSVESKQFLYTQNESCLFCAFLEPYFELSILAKLSAINVIDAVQIKSFEKKLSLNQRNYQKGS